ncbi:MAG TPA: hypothetical protein VFU92_05585 [Usitatibacter sp.]|nr:hypothetical protein [Usitatibacter sp.]
MSSHSRLTTPVVWPPGCASVATRPERTGSAVPAKTSGNVGVARCSACVSSVPSVTNTSGRSATSAVAAESMLASTARRMIRRFRPSTNPRRASSSSNGLK